MRDNVLGRNILQMRKTLGMTQEMLADKLHVSSQAVSKWEKGYAVPDTLLLPELAIALDTKIDILMGFIPKHTENYPYEERYRIQEYYWGIRPNDLAFEVLQTAYPERPLKLLEIGCGEGRDAVFFAKNGYEVTAYDVIYSSGTFHHILPKVRKELLENYKGHTVSGGINAANVFVKKPYIPIPPDSDGDDDTWESGELFTYYKDWKIMDKREVEFDCCSDKIPHRHCMNVIIAQK